MSIIFSTWRQPKWKQDKIVKKINESLISLRNSINGKKIPENQNPKKVADVVKKSSTLINNKKVKELKY